LAQQSNSDFISNEDRPALDVLKGLNQKCREKLAEMSPPMWRVVTQIQPDPNAILLLLYGRKITIGQFNIRKQEAIDKYQAVLAGQAQ
jgi:hypothetical protein